MAHRRSGMLAVVAGALLLVACSADTTGSRADDAGAEPSADAGASADGGRSLDPSSYDRSCAVDTDCTIVAPVKDCATCCADDLAVRQTTAVEAARATAREACAGGMKVCGALCRHAAVCVGGTCTLGTP